MIDKQIAHIRGCSKQQRFAHQLQQHNAQTRRQELWISGIKSAHNAKKGLLRMDVFDPGSIQPAHWKTKTHCRKIVETCALIRRGAANSG